MLKVTTAQLWAKGFAGTVFLTTEDCRAPSGNSFRLGEIRELSAV